MIKRSTSKGLILAVIIMTAAALAGCGYINIITPSPPDTAPPPAAVSPTPAPPPSTATSPSITPARPAPTPTPSSPSYIPTLQLPNIADVVAAVKPGVVAIDTETVTLDLFNRPLTEQGAGSGWIIDADGIIVTNNHVVEGAKTINVMLDDGSSYNVDTNNVYTDPLNDLAVLKINARNLPALKVGDSAALRVGDWVVAIGNSLGLGISAKQGIISRKGVTVPIDTSNSLYDLIETSAAINPGNSGGPLLDMAGRVIGITSAKISSVGVEGMGYAISSATAMPVLQQLIKTGYVVRPWIGANLRTLDQFVVLRYRLSVNKGVLITQVVSGGPSAKASLQPGDVIIAAGGKDVNSEADLTRIIGNSQIGQPLDITYYRGGARKTTPIIPVQSPPPR